VLDAEFPSVWEAANWVKSDQYLREAPRFAQKWSHWPTPHLGFVTSIEVLACNHTWQAKVAMYGIAAAEWAWSNIVPSPIELARKTLTGSYKCGFYLHAGFKSPLDVIWKDASKSKFLLEVTSPITTGFFYIWAATSAYEALSKWNSLIYAMAMCDTDTHSCLVDSAMNLETAANISGDLSWPHEIYDPNDWHEPNGGFIGIPEEAYVTANAFGYVRTDNIMVDDVKVEIKVNGTTVSQVSLGNMGQESEAPWSLEYSHLASAGNVVVHYSGHAHDQTGISYVHFIGTPQHCKAFGW